MTEPTDAEAWEMWLSQPLTGHAPKSVGNFARAVLAKFGTPPAVGEPVAVKAMGYGGSTGINDYLMSDGTVKAMRPAEVRWSAQATPQPTQAQAGAVPLTDDRIIELAGLAPNRRVCASTCMTRKIDKKPCQCYPGMRNSEALALARAIEAAHGIKGGQHGADT